ncbi:MAG: SGNH/GDSL hydrolase family protein [Candidatus Dadabacteria bacterium]|nr:SGNH/GDSL hydrolase family protein [Candidatus Dadabacteria bacterium]
MNLRNLLVKLVAILIVFIVFLALGELLIRIYLNYNTAYDIEMTKYAMNLKNDSDNELIGHMHKPNKSMELMNVMVNINSDGLRDREYPVSKSDKYRIVVLGDSLTFGWGVPEEGTFATILEENLNSRYPTEVINFGTGNYNTEQEVNLFIEKGLKYNPDKVVLFYFINDAEITPQKSDLWFLGYSHFISFYWSRINSLLNNFFPSKSFKEYYESLYDEDQEGWANSRKAIIQLRDICQSKGIQFQVVLLPELHDVNNEIFTNVYNNLSLFLEENNIDYLNLAKLFENHPNQLELWVSYDDAHPNDIAHRKIAESTIDFISVKGGK